MTDFVRLGFEVPTRPLKKAEDALDDFNDEAVRTDKVTKKASTSVGTMSKSMRSVTLTAAKAAGILGSMVVATVGIGRSVSILADFDESMARVQAITGATEVEMAKLRETAKTLGATTEFSASQASSALEFLGMAGFTAAESIEAVPAVLDLATTASLGLGRAADIASNILSGFGLAAGDAAMVTDVLAATATSANTNVEQLGSAMSFVAPVAASLGISISDSAAAIGVLGDAGIQATRAGTALRVGLAKLAKPTKEGAEAMDRLGIKISELNPASNSLADIIDRLAEANLGLSDASALVGIEASSALLALTSQNGRLRELTGELQNVEGAASEMAAVMRDNLRGDMQALGSAAQALVLALGDAGLTDAIRSAVQAITSLLRSLTGLIEGTTDAEGAVRVLSYAVAILGARFLPTMGAAAAAAAVRLGTAGAAIVATAVSTMTLSKALLVLRTALIRTGIGAIIVGAGELIFQFSRLVRAAGGFGEAMALLKDVGVEVWERMKFGVQAFGMAHAAVFFQFKADAASAMASAIQSVMQFGNNATNTFEGTIGAIKALWGALPGAIGDFTFQAANTLIDGVEAMLNGVSARINRFIGTINDSLATFGGNFVPKISLIEDIDLGEISNKYAGAGTAAGQSAKDAFKEAFKDNPFSAETPGLDATAQAASENARFYRTATADLVSGATSAMASWRRLQEVMAQTGDVGADAMAETDASMARLNAQLESIDPEPIEALGDAAGGASKKTRKLADDLNEVESIGERTAGLLQNAFTGIFRDPQNALQRFGESLADLVLQTALFRTLSSALPNVFGADGAIPLPSFAGGGGTGNGPRTGGLDGRGGFMAMLHPRETVVDHTRGSPSSAGNVEVNIHGAPEGTTAERRTGPDGREIVDVQVGRAITQGRQDSALRSRMGLNPTLARR